MRISLASPVYNDSVKIQEFIHRAVNSLKNISDEIEIVLVNDCSTDDTLEKIKEVLPQYPIIKLINLSKNSGQHIATAIALQHTTGDYIFMMDSDLQVNPEYMIDFFNYSIKHPSCHIISAKRISRSKNLSRKIGSRLVSLLLQKIGKTKLQDIGSTFKLIKRNALDKLLSNDILVQNIPILMLNLNFKIDEVPIGYNKKQVRSSNYKFSDLIFAIILGLLNFSTGRSTLVFLVIIGTLFSTGGFFSVIGIIAWGMITHSILPTNFLIFSLVLTILGVQFLLLSMIVFKLERINKNMDFRKSINQRIEYEN